MSETLLAPVEQSPGEVEKLNRFIEARTTEALRSCEFEQTPELGEAIQGYYGDHYRLATAIRSFVDGDLESEVWDEIINLPAEQWEEESAEVPAGAYFGRGGVQEYIADGAGRVPNVKVAARRLAKFAKAMARSDQGNDPKELRRNGLEISASYLQYLFAEDSVGVTAVDQGDIGVAEELAEAIRSDEIYENLSSTARNLTAANFPAANVKAAQDRFWNDTRHAGQLEFHGTGDMGGINVHGLMSRNQQVRTRGQMNAQQQLESGGLMHSVVPHFAEYFGYGYAKGREHGGGWIALPLARIIEQAPFARDARYALLRSAHGAHMGRVPTPTLEKPVGTNLSGDTDKAGINGHDRVFFASPDETSDKLPDDYTLVMHDKTRKPATYIAMESDSDPHRQELGLGYGMAERLVLSGDEAVDAHRVQQLQRDYLKAYQGQGIVVPLRRGVFAQAFEMMRGQTPNHIPGRAPAKIYNRYTPGSEQKAS